MSLTDFFSVVCVPYYCSQVSPGVVYAQFRSIHDSIIHLIYSIFCCHTMALGIVTDIFHSIIFDSDHHTQIGTQWQSNHKQSSNLTVNTEMGNIHKMHEINHTASSISNSIPKMGQLPYTWCRLCICLAVSCNFSTGSTRKPSTYPPLWMLQIKQITKQSRVPTHDKQILKTLKFI